MAHQELRVFLGIDVVGYHAQIHTRPQALAQLIHQRGLPAAGDQAELLDAGGARLLHGVLDKRLIDNGQHLLGDRLGGGQEARPQTGDRKNGFAQFLDHASTPI